MINAGHVPGNRNLHCVDPALQGHDHLLYTDRTLTLPEGARAGVLTSLGFGQQTEQDQPSVLAQCVVEGIADFVGERLTGRTINATRSEVFVLRLTSLLLPPGANRVRYFGVLRRPHRSAITSCPSPRKTPSRAPADAGSGGER